MNPLLVEFFAFQILLQAAIQPLLHYWQPYFLSINIEVNSSILGNLFTVYVISAAILSAVYAKLSEYNFYKNIYFQAVPLVLFGTCLYFMGEVKSFVSAVVLFSISQAFLGVVFSIFSSRFNEQVPSKNRAGILSSMSLFSRFGSMASLFVISAFKYEGTDKLIKIQNLFKYSSLIYMIICIMLILTIFVVRMRKRNL
jgi:hypothetical protein